MASIKVIVTLCLLAFAVSNGESRLDRTARFAYEKLMNEIESKGEWWTVAVSYGLAEGLLVECGKLSEDPDEFAGNLGKEESSIYKCALEQFEKKGRGLITMFKQSDDEYRKTLDDKKLLEKVKDRFMNNKGEKELAAMITKVTGACKTYVDNLSGYFERFGDQSMPFLSDEKYYKSLTAFNGCQILLDKGVKKEAVINITKIAKARCEGKPDPEYKPMKEKEKEKQVEKGPAEKVAAKSIPKEEEPPLLEELVRKDEVKGNESKKEVEIEKKSKNFEDYFKKIFSKHKKNGSKKNSKDDTDEFEPEPVNKLTMQTRSPIKKTQRDPEPEPESEVVEINDAPVKRRVRADVRSLIKQKRAQGLR